MYRASETLDISVLGQGDILQRTEELVTAISSAFPYYANAPDYSHFIVITQSCDLVKRSHGRFKAPYITIAAVKSFAATVGRFDSLLKHINGSDFAFLSPGAKENTKRLLERYFHNTESEHFLLPASTSNGIAEDLVVFLRLSIALRPEHYSILAAAKVAELQDIFQARLGYLKGNMYSRVGTPELDELPEPLVALDDFVERYLSESVFVTLSGAQAKRLRATVLSRTQALGRDLTRDEVDYILLSEIPSDLDIIADSIVARLINSKVLKSTDVDQVAKAKRSIMNEGLLKNLVGRLRD